MSDSLEAALAAQLPAGAPTSANLTPSNPVPSGLPHTAAAQPQPAPQPGHLPPTNVQQLAVPNAGNGGQSAPSDILRTPEVQTALEPFMAFLDAEEEKEINNRLAEIDKWEKDKFTLNHFQQAGLSPEEMDIVKADEAYLNIIQKMVESMLDFRSKRDQSLQSVHKIDESRAEQRLSARGMQEVANDPAIDAWIEQNPQKFREITKGKLFTLEYPSTWRKVLAEMKKSGVSAQQIQKSKDALQEAQNGSRINNNVNGISPTSAPVNQVNSLEAHLASELRKALGG